MVPRTASRVRSVGMPLLIAITLIGMSLFASLLSSPVGAAPPKPTATPTGPTATPVPVVVSAKKIIGYFIQWGVYRRNYLVKHVDVSGAARRLTHINYAFADVNASLKCASADGFADYNKAFDASESVDGIGDLSSQPVKGNFNQLRELKQKYPHLKVLISVGGWSLSDYFSAAARPENRAAFVASCIDMYLRGNFAAGKTDPTVFDGIDLDWEYPGACGETCNYSPDDTVNFTALLAEFRTQMNQLSAQTGKPYLLTIASGAGEDKYRLMELAKIQASLDFINLMAYDFHGAYEPTTNLHAPLYGNPADPTYAKGYWADYAVQGYLNAGVPAAKLVLGVPFYGRGWTRVLPGPSGDGLYQSSSGPARGKWENGINDYKDLVGLEASYTKRFHPLSQSVYIYNGTNWWTYDDPASLTNKMQYINTKSLGGAMFWELSGDTPSISLLSAMYSGLNP